MKTNLGLPNNNLHRFKVKENKFFDHDTIEDIMKSYLENKELNNKDLEKIKNDIERIMDICIFYYQSPQAKFANEKGIVREEIDEKYINPRLEDFLGETKLSKKDIITIQDIYNGNYGITIPKDNEIKEGIEKFLKDSISKDFVSEDEFFELYDKKGYWCEIHFYYDEDEDQYLLQIDQIKPEEKISSTRDLDSEDYKFENENLAREQLYRYFELDYSEFVSKMTLEEFNSWVKRNNELEDGIDFLLDYCSSNKANPKLLEYIALNNSLAYDSVLTEIIVNPKTKRETLKKIELDSNSDNHELLKEKLAE